MPSRLRSCTAWAMDGPPRKSLTSPIAWERWSPAVGAQSRIGRFQKQMLLKQKSDGWRRHEVELSVVEKHRGRRFGRSVIRVRYRRHFGHDQRVDAGLRTVTSKSLGITVSIAIWGTVVGAMLAGFIGERFGRRDSLRVMALFYLVSALGCALAWNWSSLLIFRFIGGLGIGGSSVLAPMYIAEIAPAKWRGRLVGLFQFNVVFGILRRIFFKLHYCFTTVRPDGVAMGLGCCRVSGGSVFCHVVYHSAKSAMAGQEGTRGRGKNGPADDGGRELRAGSARDCRIY